MVHIVWQNTAGACPCRGDWRCMCWLQCNRQPQSTSLPSPGAELLPRHLTILSSLSPTSLEPDPDLPRTVLKARPHSYSASTHAAVLPRPPGIGCRWMRSVVRVLTMVREATMRCSEPCLRLSTSWMALTRAATSRCVSGRLSSAGDGEGRGKGRDWSAGAPLNSHAVMV